MRPLSLFENQTDRNRIVALGELLVDFVPDTDDVLISKPGKIIKTASGSSGIVACAAARLGENAGFLGKIGQDKLSDFVYDIIEAQGVNLDCVVKSPEGQIGLAFIEYTSEGRNYQFYRKNSVGSSYSADDLDETYVKDSFAVHYSGMLLELSEKMRSACQEMVCMARRNGVIVSFDPNIRKELMDNDDARKRLMEAVAQADVISPTLDEARFITNESEFSNILKKLHAMGPKLVALTCDKDGAILSCAGEMVQLDGIEIDAIDPTGAGDTFSAALLAALRRGYSMEKMACYANCAGALSTVKRGVIGVALPTDVMVQEMMGNYIRCEER